MSEDINVGGVLEALNGKVDIDLGNCPIVANTDASNFTTTGKETVVDWGIPDYDAIIDIGATTQGNYLWVEIPASGIVFATSSYQNAAPTIHINKEASTNGMIAITSGYAIVEKGKFVSCAVTSGGKGYFVPFKGVN